MTRQHKDRRQAAVASALREIAPVVHRWTRLYAGVKPGLIEAGDMLRAADNAADLGRDPVNAAINELRLEAALSADDDAIRQAVIRALEAARTAEPVDDDPDRVIEPPEHLIGLVSTDRDRMGGTPCFDGTRVPIATLFENMADGMSLDAFLESWPSVTRRQAQQAIVMAGLALVQESLLPLVGQRRRNCESGAVYTVAEVRNGVSSSEWLALVVGDDGVSGQRSLRNVLDDRRIEDTDGNGDRT